MGFGDIFKNSFMEGFYSTDVSLATVLLSMAIVCLIALYIFFAYRLLTRRTFYNKNFGISLAALAIITAAIILTIQSSIVISLGMVGALSIVRFRAAIKEPVEIVFLFWSLAAGIVIGAGMIPLAVIGSAIIGVILLLFANRKIHNKPYILVLSCVSEAAEQAALDLLGQCAAHYIVKSKTVTAGGIELTAELRTKDASTAFVNQISEITGVDSATLVSYNGEYMA